MYRDRVKKATYEELEEELLNPKLIVLNRPIKIPRFNMIENVENVNDVDFNDFDLDNHNIKTMMNKATQKDYETQNHDLFPDIYVSRNRCYWQCYGQSRNENTNQKIYSQRF